MKHRFTYSKTIMISLLILFLCISNMCQVLAGGLKFADIKASKYDWARPYIEKMYHLGIVKGVTETSYAPDASVKRDEIITMMIRLMGLENDAKGKKLPATFPKAYTVPSWAVPYVAEAIDKNIITGKDFSDFRAEDAALRWEVAVFAVKALGLGNEAEGRKNLNLTFKDIYDIPLDARTYVDVAVEKGIVQGYPDNSFKPNNKITRAQAATLLNNMIRHIHVKDIIKGQVCGVDTVSLPSIEIKLSSGSYATYFISKDTSVYQEDEKGALVESSIDKKDIGSYVAILAEENNKNTAVYIEKSSNSTSTPITDTTSNYIKGIIKNINRANNTLTLLKENGDDVVLIIKGDTKTYVDGVLATLSDLAIGQSVKITVSGISIIDIEAQSAREHVKGTFVKLNFASENPEIIIQSSGKEYKYETDKYVYVRKNGKTAELKDLKIGDEIEAELEYGKIVRVIATSTIKTVSGTIKTLTISDRSVITVTDDDGREHTIYVTPDTKISRERKKIELYDLRIGYYIDAEIEGNEVICIDVTPKRVQETLQGIVQNVHRDPKVILIEIRKTDGTRETKTIYYTDDTSIVRGDSSSISIRRINEGDEILVVGEEKDGLFYANTIMNLTIDE
jgi:hypothetical protein